ncbi:leishmanolysin-related zinc metalloendopeptidase [Acaryochloris sp. CCMEE 5410]|uniref:leishmanolysin-related zinc metalloendopeptidase n=1 Tax=Acaryochloris sp. CCMEE 5410 TaxID=310037 RepID=UPI000248476B|nr:leishmanolysin-related zinc metalloendopeptidase [Acaryochloris sp. CCMEE 5410]KAI9132858.1 hypothetical protein ON05_005550 [Acaryochloris sp. CCMEE 5410]
MLKLSERIIEEPEFLITKKLIKVIENLIGSKIPLNEIDEINSGVIDLVSGIVEATNIDKNNIVQEIYILNSPDKLYRLTTNKDVALNAITYSVIDNTYLLNRTHEIWIENFRDFNRFFLESALCRQYIYCIYNRKIGKIKYLKLLCKHPSKRNRYNSLEHRRKSQNKSQHIPLSIDIRFLGRFSENQKAAFQSAALRWSEIIKGDLSTERLDGEDINGIVIYAVGSILDGKGKQLAQSVPLRLRRNSLLPLTGLMEFDLHDLEIYEQSGHLINLIIHEIGHVLGFGSLWSLKHLIQGAGTAYPIYTGGNAMREYASLLNLNHDIPVPVENEGGIGIQDGHWKDSVFGNEIMSGFISDYPNPISRVTIAAFEDLGYSVNYALADPFTLPNLDNQEKVNSNRLHYNLCRCKKCRIKL